ncbi:hypothetical protein NECAME_17975 [Necator americanus]|uniref:WD domain, G-beta repeat protein n=1 Tax=Necator americanus TaxID=51031 RepID=W2TF94_NECAM|nr:hypothetical protein NECAME_17975 [Necator americanus]ETN80725.1 hypothetical protein NECAME_17975 [Necator americanus]
MIWNLAGGGEQTYRLSELFPSAPSHVDAAVFNPTSGMMLLFGNRQDGDEFSVYDEFWNQSTMKNRVSSYFPNLPSGVRGIESPSGSTVTAFTSSMVFQYNSRTKRVESQTSLSSYLQC